MIISDVPQHAQPLEIHHHARWLDALLERGRGSINISAPASCGNVRTVVARTQEQLNAAADLVRRRYAWRGYKVSPAGYQSVTLLAQEGDKVLGTLTVRPGSTRGLLAELTHGDEIQRLRSEGHRVGELVKLAVEEGADWRKALDALVQSAYLLTRVVHELTDVVIEVNPRHTRFYQRVFGFAVAAAERFCCRAGAPSVLMLLDLEQFGRRLQLPPIIF